VDNDIEKTADNCPEEQGKQEREGHGFHCGMRENWLGNLDDRWRRMAHGILLLLSVCQMLIFFINLP
jgi:hypothetical protein